MSNSIKINNYKKLLPPDRFLSPISRFKRKNNLRKEISTQKLDDIALTEVKKTENFKNKQNLSQDNNFTGKGNNINLPIPKSNSVSYYQKIVPHTKKRRINNFFNNCKKIYLKRNISMCQTYNCNFVNDENNNGKNLTLPNQDIKNEEEKKNENFYCINCFNRKNNSFDNNMYVNKSFNGVL